MKRLYLDESGSHNLARRDPDYPVFVLGGVIIDDEAEAETQRLVDDFKRRLFGTTDIVLHTADITRNRNGFERLRDPAARALFRAETNQLIASLDLSVVACAILKDEHLERYGPLAIDPYMLSLGVLVERFCFTIARDEPPGAIVVERRGGQLDRELIVAWQSLRLNGTRYVSPGAITRRIASLELRGKCAQDAGLQLADLVVSPIARAVIGRDMKDDYAIVRAKMRRSPAGRVDGAGLVVLPKRRGRGPLRSSRPRHSV
jgi:Protein of unknown function (DUF3800)